MIIKKWAKSFLTPNSLLFFLHSFYRPFQKWSVEIGSMEEVNLGPQ